MRGFRFYASSPFENGGTSCDARIRHLIVAGWTGRDTEQREAHIMELEALGIKRPMACPTFYEIPAARVTHAPVIEVTGENTSGEVEFVLLQAHGELWIGVGSDHTDRTVETLDVLISKRRCDKPIASVFWRFADIEQHWDELVLRAWATFGGRENLYQEESVACLMSPLELMSEFKGGGALRDGTMMFGGTVPVLGGVRPMDRFRIMLEAPGLGQHIEHVYDVRVLQSGPGVS